MAAICNCLGGVKDKKREGLSPVVIAQAHSRHRLDVYCCYNTLMLHSGSRQETAL